MSILYWEKKKSENLWFSCLPLEKWKCLISQPYPAMKCDFPLLCDRSDELNTNLVLLFAIARLRRSQPCGWNVHLDALSGVPGPICVCASCRQLFSIRLSWDSLQLRPLGAGSYCHYLSNASSVLWVLTQNRLSVFFSYG